MHGTLATMYKNTRGMSVVEVLVALTVIAILGISAALVIQNYTLTQAELLRESDRWYAAEGALEMIRYIRNTNWDTLGDAPVDTPLYLAVSTSSVQLLPTPPATDEWAGTVTVSEIYRDASYNIVPAGTAAATADPDSRHVTVTVADGHGTSTLESIFVNLFQ